MTVLARDASNYTIDFTPELIQAWKAQGVGLVILQAFPAFYRQYPEQRQQMRVCAQEGMPFDVYIYDYLGDPTWRDVCLDGLTQAESEEGLKPRKLWLDEEDVETEAGWLSSQRDYALSSSLNAADAWLSARSLPPAGIYTGAWWWTGRIGTGRSERELWVAQYDNVPDASVFTPFGGWSACRIKQYSGSQPDGTDLNVLSTEEEAELTGGTPPVDDTERQQLQSTISGLVSSLGYISKDLLAPVVKQKVASKAVQQLVAGIRTQADQHNIQHA